MTAQLQPRTEKLAEAPAPASTTTFLKPAFLRAATPAGVSATRHSLAYVSRGTPARGSRGCRGWACGLAAPGVGNAAVRPSIAAARRPKPWRPARPALVSEAHRW